MLTIVWHILAFLEIETAVLVTIWRSEAAIQLHQSY